ncbi:MAG: SCO family protein [Desulfurellaceae bacterium]|nr:SCO family protein [Desulfurellaceae bacterium]
MAGIDQPNFTLIDHHGQEVSEASYPGQYLLVYFGFTHCQVICPRSLTRLTTVLESLPDQIVTKLQPLYITVDPERDRPDVMRRHLEEKFPRFTGLSGTPEQIESAKEAFKVFARRKPDPSDPDGYAVPHTAITYLIDPDGSYTTHWVETKTADVILTDLKQRLA